MPGEFGHNGSDEGFQALLTMNSETGRGIAIMGNSDAFFFVAPHVEEAVRRARGWKTVDRPQSANEAIMLLYHMNGTQGAMDAYDRFKRASRATINRMKAL